MHRSHRLRSSHVSPPVRGRLLCRGPSGGSLPGFVGLRGTLPSGGSETSHARLLLREVILEPVQRAPQLPPLPIGFDTLVAALVPRGRLTHCR